jgi:hypothetical protein
MATWKSVSTACACVVLSGCYHNVNLTVKNAVTTPTPSSLDVSVITKDKGGQETGTTSMGTVNPGGSPAKQVVRVKSGGSYSVSADLSSGVNVYKGGDKTVTTDLPNEEVDITQLLDPSIDPNDISAIEATFGRLGATFGFNPVTVPSALGSLFGGLVWFVDTTNPATAETQPVMVVPPALLTGAVNLADFQYPSGPSLTSDATISTDASVKASASVPLWGNLAGNFATNSLYKSHWSISGFGNVTKNDTTPYQDKINALTAGQKQDICSRLDTPNSHIMYVNEMYVIKSVVLTYQQGLSVSAGSSLSGGSVITASGAYDFSSSQIQTSEMDDTVLNIEGPTFTKSSMAICQPAVAAAAPSVTAHTGTALMGAFKSVSGADLVLTKPTVQFSTQAPR